MSSFFERNTALKVISIIIAIILWVMSPNNKDPSRDWSYRDVPLKIENREKLSENGLMISSEIPDTYSFDIRAKSSVLKFVDSNKIYGIISLSDVNKTGEQKVSVSIQGLPGNIEMKSNPDITINIERIISKTIPVLPKVADKDISELGKRYYEINPRFVEVIGPKSLIDKTFYAQVALSLGAKDKIMDRSLIVQILDESDEIIEPDFVTVNPEYCIITVYPYKTVKVDPVISGDPGEGYIVTGQELQPSNVLISGDPEILNVTEKIATEILDIEGATRDVVKELNLQGLEDIKLSPGQSSFIQVLVRIEKIIEKTVDLGNIELRNKPQDLEAEYEESDEGRILIIKGPESLVKAFDPNSLKTYLDLEDSSRGRRTYPIKIDNVPTGLEIFQIEPEEVEITLK